MKQLNYYQSCKSILDHLEHHEEERASREAKKLLETNPNQALTWLVLGYYYNFKHDTFNAIDSFTRVLFYDPTFVSAAEMLLKLNKDNYSLGELKYIYTLIVEHKNGTPEMTQFLKKFRDVPLSNELTVPNLDQDELDPTELPGVDDNEYIQHLISEMGVPLNASSKGNGDQCALPNINASTVSIPPPAPIQEKRLPITEQKYSPPRSTPVPVVSNNNTVTTSYGIETMTMAQLYTRQGLYKQAMDILLKMQQRKPQDPDILEMIERVNTLMGDARKDA